MRSILLLPAANVTVVCRDLDGRVVHHEHVKNAVTAVGRNVLRDLLAGRGPAPKYIALGTDGTATADSDTALVSEVYRRAVDRRFPNGNKVVYELFVSPVEAIATETANTYDDFREIGLFASTAYQTGSKASSETRHPSIGGMLFARAVIQPVSKTDEITLTVTWEINVTTT